MLSHPDALRKKLEKFSYLNRTNLEYIEEQYQSFLTNPEGIDPDWKLFFEGIEFAQRFQAAPSISTKEIDVYNLISYYRDYGHLKANLDPLNLTPPQDESFSLAGFNLRESDLDQAFQVGAVIGLPNAKLRDIIKRLEQTYCGKLSPQISGCEPDVRKWFINEFESNTTSFELSNDDRKDILHSLTRTDSLERFIHTRFVGAKRFSIEGGDALLPILERAVTSGTRHGIREIVIGMAHRGRINVLANFMGKALDIIFTEFEGRTFGESEYEGDVKYHLGYSVDKETPDGPCHVSLAFNPSHLEAVNPVVTGMARAKQRRHNDTQERKKVFPILIHGDAAFAGQGVVSETLQLSQLPGYTVGGTIHVIVNNQVGFTTNPSNARSTRYSSDAAKAIKAPVLLVNGDDVEACVRAMDIAVRFRQEFGQDVVIDMICYRRFGHNEGDEPAFTQPSMYAAIKKHSTLRQIYNDQLVGQSIIPDDFGEKLYQEKMDNLQKILDVTRQNPPKLTAQAFQGLWKGLRRGTKDDFEKPTHTGVTRDTFLNVANVLTDEPANFNLNTKVKRLLAQRRRMIEEDSLDWGMGELMAYGCLRFEGTPVRLTGQDSKRGTFTHRHAVYFDAKTSEEYCPLKTINPDQGEFCIYNSPLSEMAVLGFEYGNAITDPTFLTVWEAQFGDFANGAQIIIDQFLTSGEEKWARVSGLTLLLPHGYEGQGPEHSSARLERFLQSAAQENIQVCNLTTPANLFHVLRRQMKRDFRKPLIIMSPKSLLRHPKVVSPIDEFTQGSFHEVIADPKANDPKQVETLILCSGKIYYDLDAERDALTEKGQAENLSKLAVVRVEQLYPFPSLQLTPHLNGYPKLKRVIWAQEEPKNMGAYFYIGPQLNELMSDLGLRKMSVEYVGRTERASPATGSPKVHAREQQEIISKALGLDK